MFELRFYQKEALTCLTEVVESASGNPLVVLPTGTGKSLVIAEFLRSQYAKHSDCRVMMLTHVKELVSQNHKELLGNWPEAPVGIYSAGLGKREHWFPITFAGIASVYKRGEQFGHIDYVLIDEAHLVSYKNDSMYRSFIAKLRETNPDMRVIGLTATPWRLDAGSLIDKGKKDEEPLFDTICYDGGSPEKYLEILKAGFLAPLVTARAAHQYDTSEVKTRAGEYISSELEELVNTRTAVEQAVKDAIGLSGKRKHWLVFCVSVSHAEIVRDILIEHGISAVAVHGGMSTEERDENIRKFKSGEVTAICNCNVLTTGFNFPAIDLILMLRPTMSSGLWVQMLGRGTRTADGKEDCLVLDYTTNSERLGAINNPVKPGKRKGKPMFPPGEGGSCAYDSKQCPECGTIRSFFERVCAHEYEDGRKCGHSFSEDFTYKRKASIRRLQDLGEGEYIRVEEVSACVHTSRAGNRMVRLTYFLDGGLNCDEYLCPLSGQWALRETVHWLAAHRCPALANYEPENILSAILHGYVRMPAQITVKRNGKWCNVDKFQLDDEYAPSVSMMNSFVSFAALGGLAA